MTLEPSGLDVAGDGQEHRADQGVSESDDCCDTYLYLVHILCTLFPPALPYRMNERTNAQVR